MRHLLGIFVSLSLTAAPPSEVQKKAAESFKSAYVVLLKKQAAVPNVKLKWHGPGTINPSFNLEVEGKAVNTIANSRALISPEAAALSKVGCRTLMFHNTLTGASWFHAL